MLTIVTHKLPADLKGWKIASVAPNPKQTKSDAYLAYEAMEEGQTIEDYIDALSKVRHAGKPKKPAAELKWNFERGYITLEDVEGNLHISEKVAAQTEEVEA